MPFKYGVENGCSAFHRHRKNASVFKGLKITTVLFS